MLIKLDLKDPDGIWESLKAQGLDLSDLEPNIDNAFNKWVTYGEYVSIIIDTDTGKATVEESSCNY